MLYSGQKEYFYFDVTTEPNYVTVFTSTTYTKMPTCTKLGINE